MNEQGAFFAFLTFDEEALISEKRRVWNQMTQEGWAKLDTYTYMMNPALKSDAEETENRLRKIMTPGSRCRFVYLPKEIMDGMHILKPEK